MLTEACNRGNDPWPDPEKQNKMKQNYYFFGENFCNNLIIISNLRDRVLV